MYLKLSSFAHISNDATDLLISPKNPDCITILSNRYRSFIQNIHGWPNPP